MVLSWTSIQLPFQFKFLTLKNVFLPFIALEDSINESDNNHPGSSARDCGDRIHLTLSAASTPKLRKFKLMLPTRLHIFLPTGHFLPSSFIPNLRSELFSRMLALAKCFAHQPVRFQGFGYFESVITITNFI